MVFSLKMPRLSLPKKMELEQYLVCGSLSRAFPLAWTPLQEPKDLM